MDKEEMDLLLLLEQAIRAEKNEPVERVAAILKTRLRHANIYSILHALDLYRARKNSQLRPSSR
jgi:hypothetical protein